MNTVGKQLIEQNGSYSNNNVDKTPKRKTQRKWEVRGENNTQSDKDGERERKWTVFHLDQISFYCPDFFVWI